MILDYPATTASDPLSTLDKLCDSWVENEVATIENHFHLLGLDFSREGFVEEARPLLDDLIRIAIFHGAELSMDGAIAYLKRTAPPIIKSVA